MGHSALIETMEGKTVNIVETITIDDDTRIVVFYDEDSEDPRAWGDDVNTETLDKWRNGEVYGVVVEKRKEWLAKSPAVGTMETWEGEDSIWGCYLDDTYTARVVASEYFNIK